MFLILSSSYSQINNQIDNQFDNTETDYECNLRPTPAKEVLKQSLIESSPELCRCRIYKIKKPKKNQTDPKSRVYEGLVAPKDQFSYVGSLYIQKFKRNLTDGKRNLDDFIFTHICTNILINDEFFLTGEY